MSHTEYKCPICKNPLLFVDAGCSDWNESNGEKFYYHCTICHDRVIQAQCWFKLKNGKLVQNCTGETFPTGESIRKISSSKIIGGHFVQ